MNLALGVYKFKTQILPIKFLAPLPGSGAFQDQGFLMHSRIGLFKKSNNFFKNQKF